MIHQFLAIGFAVLALAFVARWFMPGLAVRAEAAPVRAAATTPVGHQVEIASADRLIASGHVAEALALLESRAASLDLEPVEAFCQAAMRARREAEAAQVLAHRLAAAGQESLPPEGLAAAALFVGEYLNPGRALRAVERDLGWNPDSPHLHVARAQILVQIASRHEDAGARAETLSGTREAAARVEALTRDPQLLARARWSLAVHLSLADQDAEAVQVFDSLVADEALDPGRRVEVAWQAALLAMKDDRLEDADRYVHLVLDMSRQFAPGGLESHVPYPDMILACRYALQGTPVDPTEIRHLEDRRAELAERGVDMPMVWQRFTELPQVIAGLDSANPRELEALLVRMDRSERAWEKQAAYLRCPFYQAEGYRMSRVIARVVRGDALVRLGRKDEALAEYRRALDLLPTNRSLQERVERFAGSASPGA